MANPKHISGISYVDNNVLYVVFNYSTAFEFDPLGNVEDITSGGALPTSVTYSTGKVVVRYNNYLLHIGGYKTYRITFGSGYTTQINVDYLPVHRQIPTDFNEHIGGASDCSEDYNYIQSLTRPGQPALTSSYGAIPVSDAGSVFSYPNTWERTAEDIAFFQGDFIHSIWSANGYSGGRPSGNTSGLQHVRFVVAVNIDSLALSSLGLGSAEILFSDAQYNQTSQYSAVTGFDWSLELTSCNVSSEFTYDVCIDSGSISHFTVTEQDCNSVAIPANVLNGSIPAIFNDGCGCATDCTGVDATLTITPASVVGGDDGQFTISIIGGNATYTYVLEVPSGITYSGQANPPATSNTSYTFTGVLWTPNSASGIYTVSVQDADKCIRKFKVHMPAVNIPTGCTNPAAVNYSPTATTDDNSCIICNATTNNLEIGGVDQGYFVTSQTTNVNNASAQAVSDGSIEYSGSVNPQISPFLSGNTFEVILYSTSGFGVLPTQAPITVISSTSSPAHTFSNLGTGWYAISVKNTLVPNCIAWNYYFVDYGVEEINCTDDVQIDFNVDNCGGFEIHASSILPLQIVSSTYSINGVVPTDQTYSQTLQENDTVTITIEFNAESNCSSYTESYTVGALNCENPPPPEVYGCMDPAALNYNPLATQDNGQCQYNHIGCTDISAVNHNPLATIDDGSCLYGIEGCTNAQAINYDPNATIDDGSCYTPCGIQIINSISVQDSGGIEITFVNITPTYTVTWVNNETGASITTENTATGPDLADGVYTVTVTDGNGCTEDYTLGINTTIVYGCMDTHATNYNQAANAPDSSCEYSFPSSPCTVRDVDTVKDELDACLSEKLETLFNLMKAGRLTTCKESSAKILKLLRYILSRKDLVCVYNCADSLSPTYSETPQGESCGSKWSEGGPTGDSLIWDATTAYLWGDVVKHPVSEDIYVMTYLPAQGSYVVGSDPETEDGLIYWEYCKEPFQFTDITNRLDPYIAFIRKECKDCITPGATPKKQASLSNIVTQRNATEGGSPIQIDDENIEL